MKYQKLFLFIFLFLVLTVSTLVSSIAWSPQGNINLKDRYYITNDPIGNCSLGYVVSGKLANGSWTCVQSTAANSNYSNFSNYSSFAGHASTSNFSNFSNYSSFSNQSSWWNGYNIASDLDNLISVDWANITNKFITAVDNVYIYMSGTTATFNETKLNETGDIRWVNVDGDTMTGSLNMSNNSIYVDGITLKELDEKNSKIAGPAYGVYMTGPSGQDLPHLAIQSGGSGQASFFLRSLMIADEIAGFHNTTNATDCTAYMAEIGEDLMIDCNTTTTGADLLVGDDIQIVGDTWMKNGRGDWRFLSILLSTLDDQYSNVVYNSVDQSLVGTSFNLNTSLGDNLIININSTINFTERAGDTVAIVEGTNVTPVDNYIQYVTPGASELTRSAAYPGLSGLEHVDMARILSGSDGNLYLWDNAGLDVKKFMYDVYETAEDRGSIYKSGLQTSSSNTELNISTGEVRIRLKEVDYENNISTIDEYFFIFNNGSFVQPSDSFTDFTEYSTGETIGSNKYYNIIWGVIPSNGDGGMRLMALVQSKPPAEHNTLVSAESEVGALNFFPSNSMIKPTFVPVARTVHKAATTRALQTLTSGETHIDIRGSVTSSAGAPASPSISDHDQLANLDYVSAGHLGFMPTDGSESLTANWDQGLFNFTNAGSWFLGKINASQVQDAPWLTGSSNPFDQSLNTTDDVEFNNITLPINGFLNARLWKGLGTSPSGGLAMSDDFVSPYPFSRIDFSLGSNTYRFDKGYFNGTIYTNENVSADYFLGNGSQLTDLPAADNSSWNESFANTLYRAQSWDNFTGIPTTSPAAGQSTAFSTADQIYTWGIGLFLEDLVDDTSPQLGGYLDANGENIGSTTDEIENIYVGTTTRIYFGDGQEASMYYNGSSLIISG